MLPHVENYIPMRSIRPNNLLFTLPLLVVFLLCFAVVAQGASQLRPSERRGIAQVQEHLQHQEYTQAIDSLAPLLQRQKHHPLLEFYRGIIAQAQEQYDEACSWFALSVAADPDLLYAWISLAQCHFKLDAYTDAALAFERSYTLSAPAEPRWRYNAALAWFQAGELQKAEALLLHLLQDFSADFALQWRELLVHVYVAEGGSTLEAEQKLRLALAHVQILAHQSGEPALQRWREYLVHLYLHLDMRTHAQELVAQLLEADGLEPRWWRVAAHLCLENRQYSSALVALQVAGFLAPGDEREQRLRADLCMHLGIPVLAIEYYTQMQVEKGNVAELLLPLAQAYVERHEPQQALHWLEQIDTQVVDITQMRLHAQILFMLKSYAKANTAYVRLAKQERTPSAAGRAWMLAAYAAWNAEAWADVVTALNVAVQYPSYAGQARALLRQLQDVHAELGIL